MDYVISLTVKGEKKFVANSTITERIKLSDNIEDAIVYGDDDNPKDKATYWTVLAEIYLGIKRGTVLIEEI